MTKNKVKQHKKLNNHTRKREKGKQRHTRLHRKESHRNPKSDALIKNLVSKYVTYLQKGLKSSAITTG